MLLTIACHILSLPYYYYYYVILFHRIFRFFDQIACIFFLFLYYLISWSFPPIHFSFLLFFSFFGASTFLCFFLFHLPESKICILLNYLTSICSEGFYNLYNICRMSRDEIGHSKNYQNKKNSNSRCAVLERNYWSLSLRSRLHLVFYCQSVSKRYN